MDYDLTIALRRDRLQAEARSRDYIDGYVADLPHPMTTGGFMESSGLCLVCGGHSDRMIHLPPWQKPIYAPCPACAGKGRIECDVCAEARVTTLRIGVIEVLPSKPAKTGYFRRGYLGPKRARRKMRSKVKQFEKKEAHRASRREGRQESEFGITEIPGAGYARLRK